MKSPIILGYKGSGEERFDVILKDLSLGIIHDKNCFLFSKTLDNILELADCNCSGKDYCRKGLAHLLGKPKSFHDYNVLLEKLDDYHQ